VIDFSQSEHEECVLRKGGWRYSGNDAIEGVVTKEGKALFENECTCIVVGRKEADIILEAIEKPKKQSFQLLIQKIQRQRSNFTACKDAL